MSKLTKMQITYAIERLEAALESKLNAWAATLPALPDEPKVLRMRGLKWQAIADGKMVFPPDYIEHRIYNNAYNLDVDNLPEPAGAEKAIEKSKAVHKAWQVKREARDAVIKAQRALLQADLNKVKDALYLSDSAAALAAVTTYCS